MSHSDSENEQVVSTAFDVTDAELQELLAEQALETKVPTAAELKATLPKRVPRSKKSAGIDDLLPARTTSSSFRQARSVVSSIAKVAPPQTPKSDTQPRAVSEAASEIVESVEEKLALEQEKTRKLLIRIQELELSHNTLATQFGELATTVRTLMKGKSSGEVPVSEKPLALAPAPRLASPMESGGERSGENVGVASGSSSGARESERVGRRRRVLD
jgi:hypothetical protein